MSSALHISSRDDEKKDPASSDSSAPRPQPDKMDANEEGKEGGPYVIQAPPTTSKYIKQARNHSTASTNKPIVLSRVQPQLQQQDDKPASKKEISTITFPPPAVKADKSRSDSDNRSQEIETDVRGFLKMAETKKLTVAENRHHSTFSDFRSNGNILNFERKEDGEGVDGGGGGRGVPPPAAEEMEWTASDSKYLKSKRSNPSSGSVVTERMDSARPPAEDGARQGGVEKGSEVGEEKWEEGAAVGSTFVVNITASSSHGQPAPHTKAKDGQEKKKVGEGVVWL